MQLISTLLFILSIIVLCGAVVFVALWHRVRNKISVMNILREGIGHVGISTILEYPDTPAPLIALLEEEYPRSEAILITDMQQPFSPFGELVHRFHLVRVNHMHLRGVRTLYRSRHRSFRRVVMVDLPLEDKARAYEIAQTVASYNYLLHLQGESIIARNALTYCANIIASQDATKKISLESIVGAGARLERCNIPKEKTSMSLHSDRILAWRKEGYIVPLLVLCTPAAIVYVAQLSGSGLLLMTAISTSVAIVAFLYVSCRVMSEKSLFVTLDSILKNYYRFVVERVKKIRYLYKESDYKTKPFIQRVEMFTRRGEKRERP